eukprot:TRINITY_DN9989_c0_g1_i1.p1 TRINITY_DN9989_c0_g1~~TRINITY_DN9989_c0_g1_i1.p1  ORF type:complete len:523 (+),score=129.32 TRINITY_DN9989_c0_g1_i1:138-1706(+)
MCIRDRKQAFKLLSEIQALLDQKKSKRVAGDLEAIQAIAEQICDASSQVYELVPTANFSHSNVRPLDNENAVLAMLARVQSLDDLAVAAKILLGAQSLDGSGGSRVEYIHSALQCAVRLVDAGSPEMKALEGYINLTADPQCYLYTGEGERSLPKDLADVSVWRAVNKVQCFLDSDLTKPTEFWLPAGSRVQERGSSADSIMIADPSKPHDVKNGGLWLGRVSAHGHEHLTKLSKRMQVSAVSAVYRVDLAAEDGKAARIGEVGTRELLWHGTGVANAISMLSQGMLVKPRGADQCGSAYGDGLYFANAFAKSRGYTRCHNGTGLMLLCDVAKGETLKVTDGDWQTRVAIARHLHARKQAGLPPWKVGEECWAMTKSQWGSNRNKCVVDKVEEDTGRVLVRTLDATRTPTGDPIGFEPDELQPVPNGDVPEYASDITGTGYDSTHVMAGEGADKKPEGGVVHPSGPTMPVGANSYSAHDEIIVYDAQQARIVYVLEVQETTLLGMGGAWRDSPLRKIEEKKE